MIANECAIHCLTDEPEKIIKQIRRKEKQMIKSYAEDVRVCNPSAFNRPEMEDCCERIIVKNWGTMISIFPLLRTIYQQVSTPWVISVDKKRNSPTQKFGSLHVWRSALNLRLFVRQSGETTVSEEADLCGRDLNKQAATLRDYTLDSLCQTWLHNFSTPDDEFYYNFPLLLPFDWDKRWQITKETKLSIYCK